MAFPADCKDLNPGHSSRPRVVIPRHYDEDMDDTKDIESLAHRIEHGEKNLVPLFRAMRAVQSNVYAPFSKFDQDAIAMHRWYEIFTIVGVLFGAGAVLFAVGGATLREIKFVDSVRCEFVMIVLALGVIITGKLANFKERWILARYKAERLRLLKFASLTHPDFWCDPPQFEESENGLKQYVECVCKLDYSDVERWAKRGVHPYPAQPPCKDKHHEAMDELIEHYVPKRIGAQLDYMESHWDKLEGNAAWTSGAVVVLYWGSFIFVGCHLAFEWLFGKGDIPSTDTKALIAGGVFALLALFLPILAAGIRTFRAANEFERSELRHKATFDSLNWLAWEIQAETDRAKRFTLIGFAETVLEADCREFIRLLSEAEWYG